jgi:cytochrome c-type biogenesis protein CcmH/NrfG
LEPLFEVRLWSTESTEKQQGGQVARGAQTTFPEIEDLLREGLVIRPNDFSAWMLLGNLHLLQGEREFALAAYQKARDAVPPSPVRQLFEEQIRLVSTQPNYALARTGRALLAHRFSLRDKRL